MYRETQQAIPDPITQEPANTEAINQNPVQAPWQEVFGDAQIKIEAGQYRGAVIEIPYATRFVLGRSLNCDAVLDIPDFADQQIELYVDSQGARLTCLAPAPLWISGRRILDQERPIPLESGDQIDLYGQRFCLVLTERLNTEIKKNREPKINELKSYEPLTLVETSLQENELNESVFAEKENDLSNINANPFTVWWQKTPVQLVFSAVLGTIVAALIFFLYQMITSPDPSVSNVSKSISNQDEGLIKVENSNLNGDSNNENKTNLNTGMPQKNQAPLPMMPVFDTGQVKAATVEKDFAASARVEDLMRNNSSLESQVQQGVESLLGGFGLSHLKVKVVSDIEKSINASPYVNLAVEGFLPDPTAWQRVKKAIKQDISGVGTLEDRVHTPETRRTIMQEWVKEAGLNETVLLYVDKEKLIAKTNVSESQTPVWDEIVERYISEFDNQPPLYFVRDPGKWLKIKSVNYVDPPYFITQDGVVHTVGSQIKNYQVTGIDREGIKMKDQFGTYNFEY
ncbi:MAG: EscD/YscD/HrpQ family type III secretion system periplasmic domain-containing protein [Pseudomonadota bacterium]